MWSFAIKTLFADRGKLTTALVGVTFSVVLMNIQGGLFLGLIKKASLLVDHGNADIWVGHKNMHNVDFSRDVPRRWVYRIRGIPGVQRAEPYLVGFSEMTLPSGGFESVVVVGVDNGSLLGNAWAVVEGRADWILKSDGIIVDRSEGEKLENPRLGQLREIAGRRARIAALSDGIMGFLVAPYAFTTYNRAASYLRKSPAWSSYFLVQAAPGVDREHLCQLIRQRLPDVEAFPSEEYSRISVNFWLMRTGLGISFGTATLLGLLVGLVMVAQTLYAMVLDRLSEFATLKAMGAREGQILTVLLIQATAMSAIGSIFGLIIVWAIAAFHSKPQAPIVVPLWLSLGSAVVVLAICLVSALLPYLRVRRVDPVMVLQ